MNFSFLNNYYIYYINGAITTLIISIITIFFGSIIGVFFALMKISKYKVLKIISSIYIEIIRGIPVILQVMICYTFLSRLIRFHDIYWLGIDVSRLIPGVIALGLNSAAYVAEIIRAGILAIDKGQTEASISLGMNNFKTMKYIIFPQAIKNILPALGNEFVVIIKESSILSVISISELMFNASIIQGITFIPLEPLYVAGIIYFIMTFTTSRILAFFERKMNKDDRG